MIHFVVPEAHARMMREYLELWGKDMNDRLHVVCSETLPAMRRVSPGTYVLGALDQHGPEMAAYLDAFHRTLVGRHDVRFLNHPTETLQRFDLLRALHATKRNTFRAVRIGDDLRALHYPVFVRDGSAHDGALSPLLDSPAQVEAAIGRVLLEGRSAHNLMVVEFCDTADANGYYRKYSAFVVGDHIVPRSLSYSREWMLKFQGSEFSPRMAQEEQDYVLTNPHEPALREVFALAHVTYGRIDYAMKDGQIQAWEINLNPTIGRGLRPSTGKVPPDVDAIRKPTKQHFYRRFREAWDSVNLPSDPGVDIELEIDSAIVSRALAPAEPARARWLEALKRTLRPIKPVIAPVVRLALPVLGRIATRPESKLTR